ncbi:MAG: TonB family protein [Cyclobacteriaceae bacterium]
MSNYLIELSAIHIALILGYWFFLRKERQYAKMRFYLITSTLLALTIPLLKLPKLLFNGTEPIDVIPMEAIPLDAMTITPTVDTSIWSYELLIWIYLTISVFFLLKFLNGVLYLIWLERKSTYEKFSDLYIRRVGNIKGSFTFFNWIFLSDEIDKNRQDYDVILKHEKAHASLGHTYDLMFFELFKVCFWWLPTAWFINREIREIHEYQADACALKSYNVDQYSSILISSILKSNGLSLASSFHDSLILKRLTAMKQQAKNVSPWKLGALSALCALLFTVFACSEEKKDEANVDNLSDKSKIEGKIFTIVEQQPEFEGGMDGFRKYIMNEIRYPLQARQMGVEGQVDVQFVVGKDGSLSDVTAIKGIGAGCDSEAVRVLQNAPAFKPGTQNGKPVFVRMVVPVVFKLNKGKTNPDNSTQGIIVIEAVEPKNEKFKVDANYANGEWSGTVYDEEGQGLPGANIVVAGTTTGTVSGLDGTFKVKADESKDLFISFIGYETARLKGKVNGN